MKDKLKNPYFWIGIVSIIFASAGVDFNTLTSWSLLGQALLGILQNPVAVMAVFGAIVGVFNDNSTTGLDGLKTKVQSSPSNVIGVSWSKSNNKYRAYINLDGKQKHLGYYDNLEDAVKARKEAEELLLTKKED